MARAPRSAARCSVTHLFASTAPSTRAGSSHRETSNVQCDIIAKTVSIRGQFNGVIQADRVEMLDGSQVQGVLNVNSFYMDERAVLRAAVNIRGDVAAPVQRPQPPQQPVSTR